jgi:uncharacterized metal-binding protein/predicted Fe-Mo cluster-binding NifX family protein
LSKNIISTEYLTENERFKKLEDLKVKLVVCGGIDDYLIEELEDRGIKTINNVAGEVDEVLDLLIVENIKPGFGISYNTPKNNNYSKVEPTLTNAQAFMENIPDCVDCSDRPCLKGESCNKYSHNNFITDKILEQSMEVAMDIAMEPERILCRVAELVHFCLGMEYKHVGLAFCTDMFYESEIITQVLRRFFKVTPVCCKVGINDNNGTNHELHSSICNPAGMAKILNSANTDFNIVMGLCMGTDICFNRLSLAPVTTLFVKDRLLANNPIGAVYSKYQQEFLMNKI